ncbi:MAG: YlbF family regulator [Christensenellales bacterium]|jgi:cell fate (sporulation/competence/biofilm development) regulator YlbF (YheA/YmcA/DUF963 family)
MVPNKELQELAQALKRSAEYNEIMRLRKKVLEHPRYGRQMLIFEREHGRIHGMNLQAAELSARLKKLYDDFKDLLQEEDVRKFMEAGRAYQKMISESIAYLNRVLDSGIQGRTY